MAVKNVYSAFKFGSPSSIGFALLANPAALKIGYVPTGNGITVGQGGNTITGSKGTPAASTAVDATSQTTVPAKAPIAAPMLVVPISKLCMFLSSQ